MNAVTVVGYVLELLGLGAAGIGLIGTWREHANGKPFLPPKLDRPWSWFMRTVLRKPRNTVLGVANAVMPSFVANASGVVSKPVTDDMSVAEQIKALSYNVDQAARSAGKAHHEISSERAQRVTDVAQLRSELQQTSQTLIRQDSEVATRGIPLAASGLLLAAFGLILQAIGSA